MMITTVLLVLKVATLLRKSYKVGEDHPTEADVKERIRRASLDVFGVIIVQSPLDGILDEGDRQHRLDLIRHLLHLQSP